jgi:hypothetical protein
MRERLWRPYREEQPPQRRATGLTEADILAFRCNLAALRFKLALLKWRIKAGFNPNQPRVPAGNPDGGRWTSEGGTGGGAIGRNDPRILSDATPDNDWKPGAQYAQNLPGGRRPGPILINGQPVQPTPGQAARLAVAEAQAREAISRVQERDPNWRPQPSAYESVEGLIRAHESDVQQAQARITELARVGIGPGPFAGESIPARGPERDFTIQERTELNHIGSQTGCHTCGTTSPGTSSRNFVADHQPPSALNHLSKSQRLYPQCLTCSLRQGGWITSRGSRQ